MTLHSLARPTRSAPSRPVHHARGYVLVVVLMLVAAMAGAITLVIQRQRAAAHVAGDVLASRRVFHATDGLARAALELSNVFLRDRPGATSTDLQTFLNAQQAALTPPGFTLELFDVSEVGPGRLAPVPNGPYKNMNAFQQVVGINVRLREDRSGAAAEISSQVILGSVSMFQFFAFIDGYAYLHSGSGAAYAGRIHANGNLCFGNVFAEQVTSAGSFYVSGSHGCNGERTNAGHTWNATVNGARIARAPLVNGLADLSNPSLFESVRSCANGAPFTGSLDCDRDLGTQGGSTDIAEEQWVAMSRTKFGDQLKDQSHGVRALRVPITGRPLAQNGRNASHVPVSNHENSRFLIDPIIPSHIASGEPADVREQKLAYKADIRILNGVWFKRDPSDPTSLGTPIWSDHPGHFYLSALDAWEGDTGRAAGQADLFMGSSVPRGYSYYPTDGNDTNLGLSTAATPAGASSAGQIDNNTWDRPVLSYGTLERRSAGGRPYWTPGYFALEGNEDRSVEVVPPRITYYAQTASTQAERLQGTRSGYRDGWAEVGLYKSHVAASTARASFFSAMGRTEPSASGMKNHQLPNMLPINFDVGALARALDNTGVGELGTHFSSSTFNGIVWIGSAWPGQLRGMSANPALAQTPGHWPYQGGQMDCPGRTPSEPDPVLDDTSDLPRLCQQPFHDATYSRDAFGFAQGANPSAAGLSNVEDTPRVPSFTVHSRLERYQMALPYAFCTDTAPASITDARLVQAPGSETAIGTILGGNAAFLGSGPAVHQPFVAPQCDRYRSGPSSTRVRAFPNVVRVINGSNLQGFPKGLTIATNLPMVVLGDYNRTSTPRDAPSAAPKSRCTNGDSNCFTPSLLAGDTITLQSTAWRDENAPWNRHIAALKHRRQAGDTYLHTAVLTGWLESHQTTPSAGSRDELPYVLRPTEAWPNGVVRELRGSMVIAHHAQFGVRFDWSGDNSSNGRAGKQSAYDYNFDLPINQPPGAPELRMTAIRRFSQTR